MKRYRLERSLDSDRKTGEQKGYIMFGLEKVAFYRGREEEKHCKKLVGAVNLHLVSMEFVTNSDDASRME